MTPNLADFDPRTIADESTRASVIWLINRCQELTQALAASQEEVRRLQAEVYRLKGEQPPRSRGGAPEGAPAPGRKPPRDHSSEAERREPKQRRKGRRRGVVEVDRTLPLTLDRSLLPADVEPKGWVRTVVQDLIVLRDNVQFLREKLYSASANKSYIAPLPPGYRGAFGPGVRHLGLDLGYGANVTFPKIHDFFTRRGILISRGKVSNLMTQGLEALHAEAEAVLQAGLASSVWQGMDVTATPVGSEWHACQTIGNPLYTCFRTTPQQDRMSILGTLWAGRAPRYRLNGDVHAVLEAQGIGVRIRRKLRALEQDRDWEEPAFSEELARGLGRLGKTTLAEIREAACIAAYRAATDGPVIECLHVDDASQFREITKDLSLCWVHDHRHYQKLIPQFACFEAELTAFNERYWQLYRGLGAYKQAPSAPRAVELAAQFDELCSTEVYWQDLDRCIARTGANKAKLLLVLRHPELPLHNNDSELAARLRVIKRRVSHGPQTAAGARAWDTFQTLAATAAKLGISFSDYLRDRLYGSYELPSLASMIHDRAAVLHLGWSWEST